MKIKSFKGKKVLGVLFCVVILFLYLNKIYNRDAPLPTELHPVVKENAETLVNVAKSEGIDVIITEGFRSIEEQNELYARGRTTEGRIVTYAKGGESYHNFGLAIDFALLNNEGKAIWDMNYDGNNNGKSDWMEVVTIAKELGFDWGGDWERFKDYPHLEMRFDLTIRDLQRGKRPEQIDL